MSANVYAVTFNGRNGPGDVTVPGVASGDRVLVMYDELDKTCHFAVPEGWSCVVGKDNTLEQLFQGDHSGRTWIAIMVKGL